METKKEWKWFTIYEYEKEQEYLREMHKSGWEFLNVTGLTVYHFKKCEPQDVVYQLDYNQDGIGHKEEYVQMFKDCGWEYLQDYAGYSYFKKPASAMDGAEEIFCDEDSRLQMMARVLKGRLLPLLIIFSGILLPQFLVNLCIWENYAIAVLMGAAIVLYAAIFAQAAVKFWQYKKRRQNG